MFAFVSRITLGAVFFALLLSTSGTAQAQQSFWECKAIDRWVKKNDYFRDNPWPGPYWQRDKKHPDYGKIVYDFSQFLGGEGNFVFSDRYYAIPPISTFAYGNRNTPQNFTFLEHESSYAKCASEAQSSKKVYKFIKNKRVEGLAMDIFLHVRNVDGMPVYRIAVKPLNFNLADHPEFRFVTLNELQGKIGSDAGKFNQNTAFSIQLPDTTGQVAGELRVSEWQFCEACMTRYMSFKISEYDTRFNPRDFMVRPISKEKSGSFGFSYFLLASPYWINRYRGVPEAVPGYIPTEAGLAPYSYSLVEKAFPWADIKTGQEAFEAARDFAWRYGNAKERNKEYLAFIKEVYQPLTVEAHMKKKTCPAVRTPSWGEGSDASIRAGNSALDRADCQAEHFNTYDPLPLMAIYEELVAEEEALFRETIGVKRIKLLTAEQQINQQLGWIDGLVERANKYFETANYQARREQKRSEARAAQRAAMQSAFINNQHMINNMQADVERLRQSNAAFAALEVQKQRRRQWQREREIHEAARRQKIAQQSAIMTDATNRAESMLKSEQAQSGPTYEGFDRQPEVSKGALPCADIPTPEEMRRIEAGEKLEDFDAGWDLCDDRARKVAANASAEAASTGSGVGSDNVSSAQDANAQDVNSEYVQAGAGTDATSGEDANAGLGGRGQSGGPSGDSFGGSDGADAVPDEPRPDGPRYIYVDDLFFEHRGHAFSTRDQLVKGLSNTWASRALSKHCETNWQGGDGHNGVVNVDRIETEQVASTRWVGSARLDGYCRLLSTDADYDKVRPCPSESRGQPNCYVRDLY